MPDKTYEALKRRCESEIEIYLLDALYPALREDRRQQLRAQHLLDGYEFSATVPDFAFPEERIAIYCDGYKYHADHDAFQSDRQQSRDLQLKGWLVLRFAGREIFNDTDAVVEAIHKAIGRKLQERQDKHTTLWLMERIKGHESALTRRFIAGMVVMLLIVIAVILVLIVAF